jgi:hypothetical protein
MASNSSRNVNAVAGGSTSDIATAPTLGMELWSTYALVTTDERKRMGKVPRDMLWEVVQTGTNNSLLSGSTSQDTALRYSNCVKAIFFAIKNVTVTCDRSNYTTRGCLSRVVGTAPNQLSVLEFPSPNAFDPVGTVTLLYEGVQKVGDDMYVDYFSLVQPYYYARSVPVITGYHLYSYSLDMVSTDHLGSTDFGKLTNVTLRLNYSQDCIDALAGSSVTPFYNENGTADALPAPYGAIETAGQITMNTASTGFNRQLQRFSSKHFSLAHTLVRSIGGAMGFPVF